ncbi:MAG: TIGR04282 family arsenosugar biosynthesis glycosyltransferase [Pseudomonadales bacterium]|nr:TIGR04282 family arsenosugar biosynthesis glycosyltransferase [Pseudomonadales bacterium]MCP5184717.1 TIGR04282 family arsenosugar biosynthesis glycosyltransferase [Pseudomonadales bacterium]
MSPALAVFTREPVYGQVKTRIAAELGHDMALMVHLGMVRHTLAALQPLVGRGVVTELWVSGDSEAVECRHWASALSARRRCQHGDDLGSAMWYCCVTHLNVGRNVIIVGTDIANLTADYVREAAMMLEEVDVVLGPCEDGGYGLIGLSRPTPELFRGIPWGTRHVYERTLDKAEVHGYSVASLAPLWDVDNAADVVRFQNTVGHLGPIDSLRYALHEGSHAPFGPGRKPLVAR